MLPVGLSMGERVGAVYIHEFVAPFQTMFSKIAEGFRSLEQLEGKGIVDSSIWKIVFINKYINSFLIKSIYNLSAKIQSSLKLDTQWSSHGEVFYILAEKSDDFKKILLLFESFLH